MWIVCLGVFKVCLTAMAGQRMGHGFAYGGNESVHSQETIQRSQPQKWRLASFGLRTACESSSLGVHRPAFLSILFGRVGYMPFKKIGEIVGIAKLILGGDFLNRFVGDQKLLFDSVK